jgi:hypothetical protein
MARQVRAGLRFRQSWFGDGINDRRPPEAAWSANVDFLATGHHKAGSNIGRNVGSSLGAENSMQPNSLVLELHSLRLGYRPTGYQVPGLACLSRSFFLVLTAHVDSPSWETSTYFGLLREERNNSSHSAHTHLLRRLRSANFTS